MWLYRTYFFFICFTCLYALENEDNILDGKYSSYEEETLFIPLIVKGKVEVSEQMKKGKNYIGGVYDKKTGCKECKENIIDLRGVKDEDLPVVLIGVFIEQPTPFFEEFLIDLDNLNYPKKKIHLYVHIAHHYKKKQLEEYLEEHEDRYRSIRYINARKKIKEAQARQDAIDLCIAIRCDYYFSLDATAHLDNPETLKLLMEQNRSVLAPLLPHHYSNKTNILSFPIESENNGHNKEDILNETWKGVWSVSNISAAYLINGTLLHSKDYTPRYQSEGNKDNDAMSVFCANMRNKGIFMHVTNLFEFGHLVEAKTFSSSRLHGEMYEAKNNRWDWEKRYIVQNHSQNLNSSVNLEQPCPDVFWFPLTTPTYCKELVEIAEGINKWSTGERYDEFGLKHKDQVPTRDALLKNLGLQEAWMILLRNYVQPVAERMYIGYHNPNVKTNIDFIVRYRSDEQASLEPHFDTSLYSVNMALNSPRHDYEGGGVEFMRYNCSVTDTRVGWALIHPSTLTHYHQGLPTTNGTRYIIISLVDTYL